MALQNPRIRKKLEALTGVVRSLEAKDVKIEQIIKHLREVDGDPSFKDDIKFDFPSDSQDMWFNCSPLSLERDLKGKIVVFDFFTYCCVNCLHILPDLARLEEKYPITSGLVVVGVHSAKFTNEKLSDNIKNAILRYDITHPVVNDPDVKLWDHLAITCWPTLVMFGPEGQLLYSIIGEGHESELLSVVDQAMQFYRDAGRLSTNTLPVALLKDAMPVSRLRFPGKVFVDSDKLFISDSGHHRILEVSLPAGRVVKVMGSGKPGLQDGPSSSACFNSPQGMVTHAGHLYVADTENHAIRAIDLKTYIVSTIVGNGSQGNDKEGGRMGTAQVISSPWDVTLGCSAESESPNLLFIAMSGIHQIWVYFLSKTKWLQGV
jgi:thiol-disulfide isomerase/thioredoxin